MSAIMQRRYMYKKQKHINISPYNYYDFILEDLPKINKISNGEIIDDHDFQLKEIVKPDINEIFDEIQICLENLKAQEKTKLKKPIFRSKEILTHSKSDSELIAQKASQDIEIFGVDKLNFSKFILDVSLKYNHTQPQSLSTTYVEYNEIQKNSP